MTRFLRTALWVGCAGTSSVGDDVDGPESDTSDATSLACSGDVLVSKWGSVEGLPEAMTHELTHLPSGEVFSSGSADASSTLFAALWNGSGDLNQTYGEAGVLTVQSNRAVQAHDGTGGVFLADLCESCAAKISHIDALGEVDLSFGSEGSVFASDLGATVFLGIERRMDGRLWVLGLSSGAVQMWRLTADGEPDPEWGGGAGGVALDLTWWDSVYSLADDPFGGGFVLTNLGLTLLFDEDGGLQAQMQGPALEEEVPGLPFELVVSEERLFLVGSDVSWETPRVTAHFRDGSRDVGFGVSGVRTCEGDGCDTAWAGGVVDAEGRLILTDLQGNSLWRLTVDGKFDDCFGQLGQVELDGVTDLRGVSLGPDGDVWFSSLGGTLWRAAPSP